MRRANLFVGVAYRFLAYGIIACGMLACGGSGDKPDPVGPPVVIDKVQVATTLEPASATTLAAVVNTSVAPSPSVTLRDAQRKGIAGRVVRFVANGGGFLTSSGGYFTTDSVLTDASGVATARQWRLGTLAGPQTVVASVAGLPGVTFTAQSSAGAGAGMTARVLPLQDGTVGTPVRLPPSLRVADAYDNPVPGVAVTFAVTTGGGTMVGAQKLTGADGIATADAWVLGPTVGEQRARASVAGLSGNLDFSSVARAGAAARLTMRAGDGGSGVAGLPLEAYATLPSVLVTDAFNNPVAGVPVTFTPALNSGTVPGSPVVTGITGIATLTSWTLGTTASQSLVATVATLPGVQLVFNVSALVTSFDIAVRFIDFVPNARQQLAVSRAVTRWKSVIVGNIGASRVKLDAQNCGRNWTPAIDETITNVLILARIGPIDGAGGIAGDAGPCVVHNSNGLTVLGTMLFDSADLASLESSGLVDAVVAHEMGHVLGVGTLFSEKGLVTDLFTNDPIFTGTSAAQQFALLLTGYSGRVVPLENSGGPGTFGGHWRKAVFRNELMTGILSAGLNPLSRVTVASLKDTGYDVSFSAADPFGVTLSSSQLPSGAPTVFSFDADVHQTPLLSADRQGRMQRRVRR